MFTKRVWKSFRNIFKFKKSNKKNDKILFYLGLICFELNNFDKSNYYYNEFLKKNPNSVTALYNFASLKQSMGEIKLQKIFI